MLPQRLAETVLVTPTPRRPACTRRSVRGSGQRQQARVAGPAADPAQPGQAGRLQPGRRRPNPGQGGLGGSGRQAAAISAPGKLAELVRGCGGRREGAGVHRLPADPGGAGHRTERAGHPGLVYHGSLARQDKEKAIGAFRGGVPVMLSTESAGEGRNLQFCHMMINVDLPWNPMQIEQRLGRLHRVGQTHDVLLTNLVARGTSSSASCTSWKPRSICSSSWSANLT